MKRSKTFPSPWRFYFGSFLVLLLCFSGAFSQNESGQVPNEQLSLPQNEASPKQKAAKGNSAIREDVHRFFGYENPLAIRYLSIPYDVVMGTNLKSVNLDTSFLLLMLLPFCLLWGLKEPKYYKWVAGSFLLLLLVLSMGSAWAIEQGTATDEPSALRKGIYSLPIAVYGLFQNTGQNPDATAYAILFVLLTFALVLLNLRLKNTPIERGAAGIFLFIYGALWVMLSGGLAHYGLFLFALAPLFAVYTWTRKIGGPSLKFRKGMLYGGFAIWVMLAMVIRMENHRTNNEEEALNMFDQPIAMYMTGQFSKREALDMFRERYSEAADLLNREDSSLVYVAGTRLPYYIEKSDRRCYIDNFLTLHQQLNDRFPDKVTQIEVLKASGFRYIVLDLNLAKIDKSPEKSLRKKFIDILTILIQNPKAKLRVTDRVLRLKSNGQEAYEVFHFYGESVKPGTYAIFELL